MNKRKHKNKRGIGYVGFDSIRKPTAKPSRMFTSTRDVNARKQKYRENLSTIDWRVEE